jgi:hypothetical protein
MGFRRRHRARFLWLVAGVGALSSSPRAANGADEKQACLAAADAGQSLRDDGQYSIARDQFLTCARDVCPKIVHDQCTTWLHQLDEATPTVVFGAKDEHGNDIGAARVISDGKLITGILDGKPLPLDPGAHDIRFERDPNGTVTVHVVLKAGEKNREVTATFPPVQAEPPAEGTPPPEGPAQVRRQAESSFWSARNVTSLSLLGAGVVAVGLGVYFGVTSRNEYNKANNIANASPIDGSRSYCRMYQAAVCTSLSDTRDAQDRDAILNEVFYGVGAALAAAAVASWLLWPKKEADTPASTAWLTPMVGPRQAGMGVGAAF